ncbi:hypothetical protein [Leucobacter sp. gxy201]|uniref:hypothetical protein n=1 Tax=Leucobacter sp. gxy201 TaxID=2957200 RepID=UPI003DA13870
MTLTCQTRDEALSGMLSKVDVFFDGVFTPLEAWRPRLVDELRGAVASGRLTGAQLAALIRPGAHEVLSVTERPIYGAGYCASDAVVSEGNPLAWWQGEDRSLLASSTFGPGQAAIDLVRLEWYRVPQETGERHVAGPFVDYLCSNEITLTSAVPLVVDGAFWGVACADVLVSSLERAMLADLADVPNVTLVNSGGRVVISTDPDFDTGQRYPGADAAGGVGGDGVRVARSERYPFSLVVPE